MAKIMLFIDGTWLYSNMPRLAENYLRPDFHIDFGKLPRVLSAELAAHMGGDDDIRLDVVRTYLFGSYADNYDLRDEDAVQRRLDFFAMLKEDFHYEVETFPINFRGRRLRGIDRGAEDTFEPKEKCVDIAMATTMVHLASMPGGYDIAIGVLGDEDFRPALQLIRRLGKRVAIASIKSSCSPALSDPRDEARVKDFDIIWLDDLRDKLELRYEPHLLECESPIHKGDRKVWTTFYPRRGRRFYCDACRAEFARQKEEQRDLVSSGVENGDAAEVEADMPLPAIGATLTGRVARRFPEKGYGFLQGSDGRSYFFHITDITAGLDFNALEEGWQLDFDVKRHPSEDKAGAAANVRPHVEAGAESEPRIVI
ncbi:MAG TPA: NYN domain-containing protein [bacterium]|nr:NYN domain-containing protein [bacterium]